MLTKNISYKNFLKKSKVNSIKNDLNLLVEKKKHFTTVIKKNL